MLPKRSQFFFDFALFSTVLQIFIKKILSHMLHYNKIRTNMNLITSPCIRLSIDTKNTMLTKLFLVWLQCCIGYIECDVLFPRQSYHLHTTELVQDQLNVSAGAGILQTYVGDKVYIHYGC